MKCFEAKGTDYELGLQVGEFFKDCLGGLADESAAMLKDNRRAADYVEMAKAFLAKEYPALLDEVYGRADGAGIDRDTGILLLSPDIRELSSGCTTVILKKPDGTFLLSHNEDDHGYSPENTAVIKYIRPDGSWFAGYTFAGKLLGSTTGFNSNGLIFASNSIYPERTETGYISRYIMQRDIMNSKDAADVMYRLARCKVAKPFSMNVIDTKNGFALNIEKDLERLYVTPITERYARANHYKAGPYAPVPHSTLGNSFFRDWKANVGMNLLDPKTASLKDLQDIVDYVGPDEYETINRSTLKYDPAVHSVTVCNFSFDQSSDIVNYRDYLGHTEQTWKLSEF